MRGKVVALGLAGVLGVAALASWFGFRGRKSTLAVICDAPAQGATFQNEQADENREEACGQLCGAGSFAHCVPYGDVLLKRNAGSVAAREAARDAFTKACLQGRTEGCERLRSLPSPAPAKPLPTTRDH